MIKYRNGIWFESRKYVLNSIVPTNHICHSNKFNASDSRALLSATRSTTSSCQFRSYETHSEPMPSQWAWTWACGTVDSIGLKTTTIAFPFLFVFMRVAKWQTYHFTTFPISHMRIRRLCCDYAHNEFMQMNSMNEWMPFITFKAHADHLFFSCFNQGFSSSEIFRKNNFQLDDEYFLSRFRTPMRSDASRFGNSRLLCNCNKLC